MTVTIRTATPADRERSLELLAVLNASFTEHPAETLAPLFDDLTSGARGTILLAEEDDTLLGIATVSFNLALRYGGEYCQLEELVVHPDARGKNVGGRLVEATIETARARGCAEYGLYLVAHTEHNRGFYEKYGFEMVGSEMRMPLERN